MAKQNIALNRLSDHAQGRALLHDFKLLSTDTAAELYSSALFAYYNDASPADPEYFAQTKTLPISHRVTDWFAATYYTRLYAGMSALVDRGDGPRAGYQLEALGRSALTRGGMFKYRVLGTDQIQMIELPPFSSLSLTSDLTADMCLLPARVTGLRAGLVSTDQRFPNIDLADACDRGYNFTVFPSHPIAAASMVNLLDASGASSANKFILIWCVPECVFPLFAQGSQALKANRHNVDNQQLDRLEQWVLCIPSSLPRHVNGNSTVLEDPSTK